MISASTVTALDGSLRGPPALLHWRWIVYGERDRHAMRTETRADVLTVDEAIERHPDEWIFMRVTAEDECHTPSHGLILSHHPKRHIIQRSIMKEIARRKGDEVYFLFQGYPRNLTLADCLRNIDEDEERRLDRIERLMLREDGG